jgi:hypothetical protein
MLGLELMSAHKVIPRTPEWRVVSPAMERLKRLEKDEREYSMMSADRDSVVEYYTIVKDFMPNVMAALMCAGVFAREISLPATIGSNVSEAPQSARLQEALIQVSQILKLAASRADDFRKLNSVLGSSDVASKVRPDDEDRERVLEFVRSSMKEKEPRESKPIVEKAWKTYQTRFGERFREGTTQFDPQFEDVFTGLKDIGPGRKLSFDLATIAAADWTSFLLNSLLAKPEKGSSDSSGVTKTEVDPEHSDTATPAWLRVAVALLLGFPELAEKLAATLPGDKLISQWLQDAKLRVSPQTVRRNVLVLTVEQGSLTEGWKPSPIHGSMVASVPDFIRLLEALKTLELSKPADFPIDLVCIELKGDRALLARLVTQKPSAAALMETPGFRKSVSIKDLDLFFEIADVCYLLKETPPPSPDQLRYVAAPKGIDDLIDRLPPIRSPALSAS